MATIHGGSAVRQARSAEEHSDAGLLFQGGTTFVAGIVIAAARRTMASRFSYNHMAAAGAML
jgi:hypothetical protein